jgi:hypothetical protein
VFQPEHCIVLLKNLTAASISPSVLRETYKVILWAMSYLKSAQFVCLLLKLGCFSWFSTCAASVIKTGEWSEDSSKHDSEVLGNSLCNIEVHQIKQFIPLWWSVCKSFKLFLFIVLSTSRLLGVENLDPQSVSSCENQTVGYCKNILIALTWLWFCVEDKQLRLLRDRLSLLPTH